MQAVTVGLAGRKYEVIVGSELLPKAGSILSRFIPQNTPTAVVTDNNVYALHGESLKKSLQHAGINCEFIVLPPGERTKSIESLAKLYSEFARIGITRNGVVIAFGGGVIGDLCGFTAATYMRGIRYVQIPTTLLAQVDSSVGGKTAIDIPEGKNLAGAFHQPCVVIADTDVLSTLPEREIRCGMGEVIKYAAICSNDLYEALFNRDTMNISDVIVECCKIKSRIVENDELDTGERMILNFGHTFGHAIEKHFNFERYNHGEAVAIGMFIACLYGEEAGVTPAQSTQKLKNLLEIYGLDYKCNITAKSIVPAMILDKKSGGSSVNLILIAEFGKTVIKNSAFDDILNILERIEHKWTT